jgi:hypothetical protein
MRVQNMHVLHPAVLNGCPPSFGLQLGRRWALLQEFVLVRHKVETMFASCSTSRCHCKIPTHR